MSVTESYVSNSNFAHMQKYCHEMTALHSWEASVVSGNKANIRRLRAIIWSQTISVTYQL